MNNKDNYCIDKLSQLEDLSEDSRYYEDIVKHITDLI